MNTAARSLLVVLALLLVPLAALLRTFTQPAAQPAPLTRRQLIHAAIADHALIPYTSDSLDAWDVISQADEDPAARGSRVLGIYDNGSWPRASADNDFWNREHVWPRSFGVGDPSNSRSACTFAANDLHQLFASDEGLNTSRSNYPFDDCADRDCTAKALLDESSRANWMKGGDAGKWEVWGTGREIVTTSGKRVVVASGGRRGDIARALFYMDARYEGGSNARKPGCAEPDLVLTDDRSKIVSSIGPVAYMGMLSTLLRWHVEDPVDDLDRHRNDVVASYQGNRNPFIDHPDWACALWGGPQCALAREVVWLPAVERW